MEIRMNLYADWRRLVLSQIDRLLAIGFAFTSFNNWKSRQLAALAAQKHALAKAGASTKTIDDRTTDAALRHEYKDSLIHMFLDFQYRIPYPKPRKVVRSVEFLCPAYLEGGLEILEASITEGRPLFPHLSRRIFNASEQDGMLFDWGILHFHLGTAPDPNHKGMLEGTREILYATITDDEVYFLIIAKHGLWANKDLLRLVKRNFPNLIDKYKMPGVLPGNQTYSDKDHVRLRAAGVNPLTEIDGEVYFSPGGGINTAGGSMTSVSKIQQIIYQYQVAEKFIKEEVERKLALTVASEEDLPEYLEFNMEAIEDDRITVIAGSNNLRAVLFMNEDRTAFDRLKLETIHGT